MRDYSVSLVHYGVSRDAYQEMRFFCRQYDQKKRQALRLLRRDPIPWSFINVLKYDVERIEDAVNAAAPDFKDKLLLHVTRDLSYEQLQPPCSRRLFLQARRRFYVQLYQDRGYLVTGKESIFSSS